MNIAFTHLQVSRASAEGESHLQAPRKKVASRRVDQKNPPFEDFKGTLIGDVPRTLLKKRL